MTNSSADLAAHHIPGASPEPGFQSESDADSLMSQGREFHRHGHLELALNCYESARRLQPAHAPAWHLSGVVQLQQGELQTAIDHLKKAVELSPQAGYFRNLGEAYQCAGDHSAAVLCFEQSLRQEPLNAGTWSSLSESLMQMGEMTAALDCLGQALKLNPAEVSARFLLANTLKDSGDLDEAASHYRFVLENQPDHLAACVNLASVLRASGEVTQAVQLLRNAVKRGAHVPAIAYNLANTLVDIGEFDEGRIWYQSSLAAGHPEPAKVFYNLASITRFQGQHREELNRWKEQLDPAILPPEQAVYAHFAFGKAHDDLGEFEQAFSHYHAGNRRASVTFDPSAHRREVREIISCWSRKFVDPRRNWGNSSDAPIFIVGMPRSGTTLVEQLLARHSGVQAGGERETFRILVESHAESIGAGTDLRQAAERMTQGDLHEIATAYLDEIPLLPGKSRITDKMPSNFMRLGWIATCFPNAAIIHCRRDPRDTCLSAYFQHFTNRLPYTYDLNHLISYYRDYELLMSHWHGLFPGRILDVQYESLVESPDDEIRSILSHCGLKPEMEAKVIASQPVRTASAWQVRQPIHTRSRQRWRNYQSWIEPLIQEFGDQ